MLRASVYDFTNLRMKEFLNKLTALDLIFYEVHKEDYDPIKDIRAFWNAYDISTCNEYFIALFTVYSGNPLDKEPLFDADQMFDFMVALMRMYTAYHMAHYRNIDLEKVTISAYDNSKITAEELKIGEKMYRFFTASQKNH